MEPPEWMCLTYERNKTLIKKNPVPLDIPVENVERSQSKRCWVWMDGVITEHKSIAEACRFLKLKKSGSLESNMAQRGWHLSNKDAVLWNCTPPPDDVSKIVSSGFVEREVRMGVKHYARNGEGPILSYSSGYQLKLETGINVTGGISVRLREGLVHEKNGWKICLIKEKLL